MMANLQVSTFLLLFAVFTLTTGQTYDDFIFQGQLVPSDVAASDFYGGSTAAYGEYAVSSTFLQDTDGQANSGAAYVYKRNDTTLEMYEYQKIKASTVTAEGRFGFVIDMCYKFIITWESGTNTLYFFERDNTDQFQIFDTQTLAGVHAVACAGNYFAAGTGSLVQFYRYNSGTGVTVVDGTVSDSTSVEGSSFGDSLAMYMRAGTKPYVVVGAPEYDAPNGGSTIFDQGAVFVYERTGASTWILEATLQGSDTAAGDKFGFQVALHNDAAVITRTTDGGKGYVFTRDANDLGGWTEQTILDEGSAIGDCVALNDEKIVISDNAGAGTLHAFSNDGTYALHTSYAMTNYLASTDDNIGDSCALTDLGHLIAGGTRSSVNGASSGSIVVFREVPNSIGGYRDPADGLIACDANWQYRATAGSTLVDPDADGCLSVIDPTTQPYEYDNPQWNATDVLAVLDTSEFTLDTTRYCAHRQRRCNGSSKIYRPDSTGSDPNCDSLKIQKAWGYCIQRKVQVVTGGPTVSPTQAPSPSPSISPTGGPTGLPSTSPTENPSYSPSASPTGAPSVSPTSGPSVSPSISPTRAPTQSPTKSPTDSPSISPTAGPTGSPSISPTSAPTESPTTPVPSTSPTLSPSSSPTASPSVSPSASPTIPLPSTSPTKSPTDSPSSSPSNSPTLSPVTFAPTVALQCGCPVR